MISVENLNKKIKNIQILKNVNLDIPVGKVVGIIGVSGSGKTTLLMCLCGLMKFEQGKLHLNSHTIVPDTYENDMESIWKLRRETGIVFQHLHLFPHLSVLGNIIEAPIHVLKKSRVDAEKEALDLLTKVGLDDSAEKYPEQLSGGEQQRVAICRAIAMNPKILFLDEPTSALDPQRSADIRRLMTDFVKDGSTLVIVSHSLHFLKGLADMLAYMESGEIIEYGKADDVINSPKDQRTRYFLEHF